MSENEGEVSVSIHPPSAIRAFQETTNIDGLVNASIDSRYAHPFGRDGLVAIRDVMEHYPQKAETELLGLAALQGTQINLQTQERRGKIMHEKITRNNESQARTLEAVLVEWGIARPDQAKAINELVVYFNGDTTQMYVNEIAHLCQLLGNRNFLNRQYTDKEGHMHNMKDSLLQAMAFLEEQVRATGLVEYYEPTPPSHRYAGSWKDGFDSTVLPDGTQPNTNAAIAPLITQGLTAQAFESAAYLMEESDSKIASEWKQRAVDLRRKVLEMYRTEDGFLAMGLDHDPQNPNHYRQLAPASDAGAVLRTGILNGLSENEQAKYLEPLVRRLMSKEFFIEGAGIVCLSRQIPNRLDYVQYQGRNTVWIKEQKDIADGFQLYGLYPIADYIRATVTNAMNKAQGHPEFLHVTDDELVDFDPLKKLPHAEGVEEIVLVASDKPTGMQTWSISGELDDKYRRTAAARARSKSIYNILVEKWNQEGGTLLSWEEHLPENPVLTGWREDLCNEVLATRPLLRVYKTGQEIAGSIPTSYYLTIDTIEGKKRAEIHKKEVINTH